MNQADEVTSQRPNKSARKRELAELQQLAEQMAGLGTAQLLELGVDTDLIPLLQQLNEMPPSGSRNRHIKYCVRFMNEDALGETRAYLADRRSQKVSANQAFHRLEQLRDRLVQSGDRALAELIDDNPGLDRQHLRRLVRDAQSEHQQGSPAGAGKKLFRFLRDGLS